VSENSAELLGRYRRGDPAAADALFHRYADRLLALARSRLSPKLARRIDPDDVVQSVYRSFFIRAREGEFTADRDGDLWRLLATITLHKLGRQAKHHRAAKRSQDCEAAADATRSELAEQLADREPSVADVVAAAEELHWLMRQLEPIQRQALQLRLQGLTAEEIAATLGRSERTIRRWLVEARELLLDRWSDHQHKNAGSAMHRANEPAPTLRVSDDSGAALAHADYHLEALIGSGGMCKVYAATHRSSGRRVAVKVLRKRLRSQPLMVDRFLKEAQIVARFAHPNIVPVHGLGRLPDGGYFMVMDLVDGTDLAQLSNDEPISIKQAAAIVATVAEAVQHAHDRGVIHRDLKPGNVLVDRGGRVFVTDFGFAWFNGDRHLDDEAVVGTVGFMAPEQIDHSLGEVGPHTDVYGLGALLFVLCCGQPPYAGGTVSEVLDRVVEPEAELSYQKLEERGLPSLRQICERCLAKNWRLPFASASEVAMALKSVI
jgi:eukaryotic-like serine/threonine-protein kinase